MYCSTCGARVPAGRRECDTCGTRLVISRHVARTRKTRVVEGSASGEARFSMSQCPRCRYRGEGVGYFSRGSHVAALVAATVLTAGAAGAAGIIFYFMRREDLICPRCGAKWGKDGRNALVRVVEEQDLTPQEEAAQVISAFEPAGRGAGFLSTALLVLAALLVMGGILGGGWEPMVIAAFAAGGGLVARQVAARSREERRRALIAALQLPVLKLAAEHGGRLTVTQTAAHLGWTLPRAEKVLASLEDGFRVASDVSPEGVIVYEFRELADSPDALPLDEAERPPRLAVDEPPARISRPAEGSPDPRPLSAEPQTGES